MFFIPSPRSIPEVKQPIVDLLYHQHDVLWLKYYPELEAYRKARSFFLNSPEKYDYFCIIPDDLAINQDGLHQLFRELDNPTIDLSQYNCTDGGQNYPVLAGVCNYSYLSEEQMNKVPASISSTLSHYMLDFDTLERMKDRIIKCAWIGFSCQFIYRSVLEQVDFKQYPDLGLDNTFSDSIIKKKIPQFLLKTAKFVHYKGLSAKYRTALSVNPDIIYQGIYKPYVIFVPRDKPM